MAAVAGTESSEPDRKQQKSKEEQLRGIVNERERERWICRAESLFFFFVERRSRSLLLVHYIHWLLCRLHAFF